MGNSQRRKGQNGERELCIILSELLGIEVTRMVRQHRFDADVQSIGSWSLEVKRHKKAGCSDIVAWWNQACRQAEASGKMPVLAYRLDFQAWKFIFAMKHVADAYENQPVGMYCTVGLNEAVLILREKVTK